MVNVHRISKNAPALDFVNTVHMLQMSYAKTGFRLTIAKAPKRGLIWEDGYELVSIVTATRNLGTQNAQVITHVILMERVPNIKEKEQTDDEESVGLSTESGDGTVTQSHGSGNESVKLRKRKI